MGRPPVVAGQPKDILFSGIRISAEEEAKIKTEIADSGKSKSEWGREALLAKARPVWIICRKWSADDLQSKSVEFDISTADGGKLKGTGRFWVLKHRDGVKLAIEIHGFPPLRSLRVFLDEKLAEVIERHPDASVAEFRCFASVEAFQRLG